METMEMKSIHENRIHSTDLKKFSYYECKIPEFFTSVPMHWHDEFELIYIRDGNSFFRIGNDEFESKKGDIIFILSNEIHAIYEKKNCKQTYDAMVFDLEAFGFTTHEKCYQECIFPLMTGTKSVLHKMNEQNEYYEKIKPLVLEAFEAAASSRLEEELLVKSNLSKLLWYLMNYFQSKQTQLSKSTGTGVEALRATLLYISRNYKKKITIKQLAEMNHCSESSFMAQFKKAVGTSAIEYIIQVRVRAVCNLLRDTSDTILEIALDNGFTNLSNFNRHFKRILGLSPKEYRLKQSFDKN